MEPRKIVDQMLENDAFSTWLGLEVISISLGESRLKMTIRSEMCNGFGTAHGGIAHSFADSAFAFACNTHGFKSVAAETSISFLKPLFAGDEIEAHCTEIHRGSKLGRYSVQILKSDQLVAQFHSTCYVLPEAWE